MLKPAQICVFFQNHFDLVWRRCWKRSYEHLGLVYRSYADLQDAIITRSLKLAVEQGAAFQLEQALSLREYLRRHPDTLPIFQRLAREGRFALLGAGEAIIDTNMCHGETLARNLASGIRFAKDTLGQTICIGYHGDGFGSSAQFPQIARLCGLRGIDGLSYLSPDAPYWRGLDGSTVLVQFEKPGRSYWYDHCYYKPCLECRGHGSTTPLTLPSPPTPKAFGARGGEEVVGHTFSRMHGFPLPSGGEPFDSAQGPEPVEGDKGEGDRRCAACEGTGLRLNQGNYPVRDWAGDTDASLGRYAVSSEEMLPDERLPALIAERNAEGREQYAWQTEATLMPLWKAALDRVDNKDVPVSSRVENNPVHSGTLVSRIRVKQAARRAEGWFYAAEKLASLTKLATGRSFRDELEGAWLNLPLLFFHDAVTGTHNDPASLELLEMADNVVRITSDVAEECVRSTAFRRNLEAAWKPEPPEGGTTNAFSLAVFNPHSFTASLPVEIPSEGDDCTVVDRSSTPMPVYRQPSDCDESSRDDTRSAVGPAHWRKRGVPAPRNLRFLAADIPPLSLKVFRIQPSARTEWTPLKESAELGTYRLAWDEHGVRSIFDSSLGQELLDSTKGPLGHLILETDIGDPWGTRSLDRPRVSCAAASHLLTARRSADAVELVFDGRLENGEHGREKDPCVYGLQWRQTIRVLRGLPWVELEYEIFWESVNRRIRLVFPSRSITDRGLYKIPYGVLRRDRYEMKDNFLWSPNGDWPATYFAATEPHGNVPGIAVLNTGSPSVRIEDGTLMYSVLRSPGFGHCLMRYAQEYPMPLSEMRDGGHHRFRFALMPHTDDNLAHVLESGYVFNHPAPAFPVGADARDWSSGISVNAPGVYLSAVKESFDSRSIVLRLVEQLGKSREVIVTLPETVESAQTANLLEEPEATLPIREGAVRVPVTPYSIRTLIVTTRTK